MSYYVASFLSAGIIFYYIMMQLVVLWLFQVTFVFWGTWWPINARRFLLSGKSHCLHAILLHLGLFLPVIPVVTVGLKGGFTLTRHPPIVCASPHVNANFFSMILPISIMIACGASLLILVMREVIKVRFSGIITWDSMCLCYMHVSMVLSCNVQQ